MHCVVNSFRKRNTTMPMPEHLPPQIARSLCAGCVHRRIITSGKGSVFLMCELGISQAGWPKYPPQPVAQCPHFRLKESQDLPESPG